MPVYNRKSAPKVRSGTVQKQNHWDRSPHYANYVQDTLVIDRLRPGKGYRHVLRKADVECFIALLPDWTKLSVGLDAIILDEGDSERLGWYGDGIVAVGAWTRDLDGIWEQGFVQEHHHILELLGVEVTATNKNHRHLAWTEPAVRAFQLMHILLHELGHHHDLMTTRSKNECARGEPFAESYANTRAAALWPTYFDAFGW